MRRAWFLALTSSALPLLATMPAQATLILTPADADFSFYQDPPEKCEPGCINSYFSTSFTKADLLYKAEDGKLGEDPKEEGSYLDYYLTTFSPQSDAEEAVIDWDGPLSILCGACYLAVKDGRQDPNYYLFDLGALNWNGTESIALQSFWLGNGAISHVSIWGTSTTSVPEPTTLSLLGAGLLAAGILRRRRKPRAA